MTAVASPSAPVTGTASSRSRALATPLAGAAMASGAVAILHATGGRHLGPLATCWFHAGTGLWCPFCGSLRAVAALSDGRFLDALSFNLPLVLALPFVLAVWTRRLAWGARGRVVDHPRLAGRAYVALAVVLVAFGVLRNTPYGAWLAP